MSAVRIGARRARQGTAGMGCAGSSSSSDDDTELDEIRAAVCNGEGVAGYKVSGAGTKRVNGTYLRDGMYEGAAPVFKHEKHGNIWLVRWSKTDWYIGDKDKLDDTDGDFYVAADGSNLPPSFGWEKCSDGAEPAPTLSVIAEGPSAFLVSGAGVAAANGTYRRDGTHECSPLYTKNNLWLVRCRCARAQHHTAASLCAARPPTHYPPIPDRADATGTDGSSAISRPSKTRPAISTNQPRAAPPATRRRRDGSSPRMATAASPCRPSQLSTIQAGR